MQVFTISQNKIKHQHCLRVQETRKNAKRVLQPLGALEHRFRLSNNLLSAVCDDIHLKQRSASARSRALFPCLNATALSAFYCTLQQTSRWKQRARVQKAHPNNQQTAFVQLITTNKKRNALNNSPRG